MARIRKPLGKPSQARLVLERLRTEPKGPVRQRLRAIQLGLEGELGLEEIAAKIGSARSAVQDWFDRYRAGGLKALLGARRGSGPQSWLTPRFEAFLREGLDEGRWRTVVEVHRALVKRGLEIQPPTVYNYLRKIRGLPRPKRKPVRKTTSGRMTTARRKPASAAKAAGSREPASARKATGARKPADARKVVSNRTPVKKAARR